MRRPIKFRAWLDVPDEKSMIYDLNSPSLFHGELVDSKDIEDRQRYVFMQFTGLHDKNGKEIYEGDIVKSDDSSIKEAGEIVYEPGNFRLYAESNYKLWSGFVLEKQLEIIGNIFENPELLDRIE